MNEIKPVILPKDNGPHDFIIEWWYFNGHLKDKNGKEYGFMDCFFKVNFNKVNIPHILPHLIEDHFKKGDYIHFSHSVISDISSQKNYKEIQNISLLSDDSFKKELLFIKYKNSNLIGDHLNSEIIETSQNNFHIQTKHLDLNLESKKSPLLEGGHGYVGTIESGSYYYSLTDMCVKGKINIEGVDIEVEGEAWMDHQWANAVYKKDKWTWFSFNLENGTEIMCVEYATAIGADILVNIIDKNGNQSQYKKANFKIGKEIWKSKKTKALYPLSWTIEIPEGNIEIETTSLMKDQEMIFGQINYWEGPMDVKAKINGETVEGRGFMELVGYPSNYNYLLLVGKEVEKSIFNKIKNLFK
jgi:predicted secreted hydrolase